jgi:amino acid transporter
MAAGLFGSAFLDQIGVWNDPPTWSAFLIGGLALLGVLALTISPVRRGTRVLLSVEGITVLLILLVGVVVLAKLAGGSGGKHLTLAPFTVAPGTDSSGLFLGVVFGFLSFAGFEAAATLGEEAAHPRRDIPRAILGTALFGGVYFVFVTWIEVMGFGADDAGMKAFASSSSLMGDLGTQYVGSWVGDIISLGAAVSAFGCALACAVSGSRLMYALSRDGLLPAALQKVSPERKTPTTAAVTIVAMMYVIIIAWAVLLGAKPFDEFLYSGTIGTLILLVAYVLATLGAIRLVFFRGETRVARWEIAVPVAALVVLGYTIFRNVVPYPTGAAAWLPVVCVLGFGAAVVGVLVKPELARAGEKLTADEGLSEVADEERV